MFYREMPFYPHHPMGCRGYNSHHTYFCIANDINVGGEASDLRQCTKLNDGDFTNPIKDISA